MSYRIEAVLSPSSKAFQEAYGALAAEFAPRGELERRDVVAGWLDGVLEDASEPFAAFQRTYHLLVARDDRGAFAGVRECHTILDVAHRVLVVYLAHALVMPAFRRTGLGALFRNAPIALANRLLATHAARVDPSAVDVLLAAEMEPVACGDEASVVRLVAYARDRFAVLAPSVLPYCQPDFRDLEAECAHEPRPIPLLALVRWLGHEGAASLPRRLARAVVIHLYAVFATHVRAGHLTALRARTLEVLDASNLDEVPLLPLPRATDDETAILPLMREAVLPFFPEEIR